MTELTKSETIKNKKKKKTPGRGLESLYRISMNNHVQFDKIADNKANMLISINAIILSIVLTTMLPTFLRGELKVLIAPSVLLIVVNLITIILSIIAAAPKNTNKILPLEDYKNEYGKLLFFGNFHEMDLDTYLNKMGDFQKSEKLVYNALNQNFYLLGKFLAIKYKFLALSYMVFMYGLILTVITFLVSLAINGTNPIG